MEFIRFSKVHEYCGRELLSLDLVSPLAMLSLTNYPDKIACDCHQIDNFYIALLLKGEMTYQERGKSALTGRRGDVFVLSTGNEYSWNVTKPTISLQCQHNGFPVREYGMAGSVLGSRNYPVTRVSIGEAVTNALEKEIEQGRKEIFSNIHYSSAILRLLVKVATRMTQAEEENPVRSINIQLVSQCAAYIDNRLDKSLDIGEMAKELHISKRKLFLIFQAHFGMSPLRYISMRKVEHARQMIMCTSLSNAEIARMLGFTDTNYFIRFYKKHTGYSPMQMRKPKT